jgi:hypothetical protein
MAEFHSMTSKQRAGLKRQEENVSSDIHYFKTWTPNMAWLLGYIWADGAIVRDDYGLKAVSFGCQERDAELIHMIRGELKATQSVRIMPPKRIAGTLLTMGQPSICLRVNSRILAADLVELHGILPNKSNIDSPFPSNIPDELMGHFARGNLDGDGCISYGKAQGMSSGDVTFLGNQRWLEGFRDAVSRLAKIEARPVTVIRGKKLHRVRWQTKEKLIPLYEWLYPDGEYLHLGRKREAFRAIVEYQRDHVISQTVRNFKPEEDEVIRARYPLEGTRLAASMPGRTRSSIEYRAAQLGVACSGSLGRVKWKPDEDETIREMFPTATFIKIASVLKNRTPASVAMRAWKIGLRKNVL